MSVVKNMENESEIREQISSYNNQIYGCEDDIANIQREIEQLEELSFKLDQLKRTLADSQRTRMLANEKIRGLDFNKKMTREYCDGTKLLLTGDKYSDAESGITTAKQKTEEKIAYLRQQLSNRYSQINYCQDMVNDLYNQLYRME